MLKRLMDKPIIEQVLIRGKNYWQLRNTNTNHLLWTEHQELPRNNRMCRRGECNTPEICKPFINCRHAN